MKRKCKKIANSIFGDIIKYIWIKNFTGSRNIKKIMDILNNVK